MSLTELLGNVGLFGGAVMVCLALLSVFSVGMIIDKHRRFGLASRESEKFKAEFKKFLHGGDFQDLIEAGKLHGDRPKSRRQRRKRQRNRLKKRCQRRMKTGS